MMPNDCRIARLTRETQLVGAIEEPLAIEGDRVRGLVLAREQIGTKTLRPVVPDLGAVQRQHDRLAEIFREPRPGLGEQSVAVNVDDVGAADERPGLATDPDRARNRPGPEHALRERACRSGNPRHVGSRWRGA